MEDCHSDCHINPHRYCHLSRGNQLYVITQPQLSSLKESPLVSPYTRGLNLSGIFRVPEIGMFIKTKVTNFAPLPHSDVKVVQKMKGIFVIS
jgi:hypothetical protein